MVLPKENEGETQKRKTLPFFSLAIVLNKNLKSRTREMLTAKHRKKICCINRNHFKQLLFRLKLHFIVMQRTAKLKRGIIKQKGYSSV